MPTSSTPEEKNKKKDISLHPDKGDTEGTVVLQMGNEEENKSNSKEKEFETT